MISPRYKIYYDEKPELADRLDPKILKNAIKVALLAEKVNVPCEINVYITDDEEIHSTNKEFRNIDRSTDVLSFPMNEFTPGKFSPSDGETDPETGRIALGDIMISASHAKAQAEEYGHSIERESVYLVVHSVLHLLGYDHVDEGAQKKQMRKREKMILKLLGL